MYKEYFEGKKAIFFDLDGTVIDSLPLWERAYTKVAESLGNGDVNLTPIHTGSTTSEIWKILLGDYDFEYKIPIPDLVTQTKKEYLNALNEYPLEVMEGFWSLIHDLKEKLKLKVVLISNSDRDIVNKILEKLNLNDIFDFTICGDEVKNRKPNPEIYNVAASKMGLNYTDVLVFEDSISGVTSSTKAHMDTIVILGEVISPNMYPKSVLTFLSNFEPLIGNLELTYEQHIKKAAEDPEIAEYTNPD